MSEWSYVLTYDRANNRSTAAGASEPAKRKAAAEGRTLKSLIADGLRMVASDEGKPAKAKRVLPPVAKPGGGLLPGVELEGLASDWGGGGYRRRSAAYSPQMMLADVNILTCAFRLDLPQHGLWRPWLVDVVRGDARFGLSTMVLRAVVRIPTNIGVCKAPNSIREGFDFCQSLLSRPHCRLIEPGERHRGRHWQPLR